MNYYDGLLGGLVAGLISLIINLGGFLIWFGYHKRRHEDIDLLLIDRKTELKDLLMKHEDRTKNCPIIKIAERQETSNNMVNECRSDIRKLCDVVNHLEARQIDTIEEKKLLRTEVTKLTAQVALISGRLSK